MQCFYFMLFSFGLLLLQTEALDCTGLPMDSDVESAFRTLLVNQGGEGGVALTIRSGPFYTCQAQGSTIGIYRELSVVMTYARDATPDTVITRQFELDCTNSVANTWSDRSNSLSTPDNGFDYMNSLRTDCARCVNTVPNENHCQPCDSACNSGLMRCTGSSSGDCCMAFDNGVCTDQNCTETNFVANEQNNYTCSCGVTCDSGYELNSTSCSCILTDTCLANSPCANGICVLGSTPDQYTCNCTGTNFIRTNCSACATTCGPGLVLNSTSCSCILNDTCLANSPCANGICVSGSIPDQYTCNCTGTNFVGMNCSEPIGPDPEPSASATFSNPSFSLLPCLSCTSGGCCAICSERFVLIGCSCIHGDRMTTVTSSGYGRFLETICPVNPDLGLPVTIIPGVIIGSIFGTLLVVGLTAIVVLALIQCARSSRNNKRKFITDSSDSIQMNSNPLYASYKK